MAVLMSLSCEFVAACEQDHNFQATLGEVDAVARTEVDPDFRHAFTNRFAIAKITLFDSINPGLNTTCCLFITQGSKPHVKLVCGVD